ncbi:MAG: rane protein [Bacilli bacterium]|jgi:lia operon protein LiaF|nr:rane protein [Bacilli bacterium]
MENDHNNRKRNTYLILIAAGIFLLVDKIFGFSTVVSIVCICFGILSLRNGSSKKGYIFLGIGVVILIGHFFAIIVGIVLLSLGLFYLKSKRTHWNGAYVQKQKLIESIQWNKRPWSLLPMSIWNVVGEIKLDFGFAIWEEPDVTIILQGVFGDIDVIVPENVGISVMSSVVFGQIEVEREKEAGVLNKIMWQSPNYHSSTNKVKLIVSYIVADIDVKII